MSERDSARHSAPGLGRRRRSGASLGLLGVALACGGRAADLGGPSESDSVFEPVLDPGSASVAPARGQTPAPVPASAPGFGLPPMQGTPPPSYTPEPALSMGAPPARACPEMAAFSWMRLVEQAEVDALAGCESLYGLSVANALDLRPLAALRRVVEGLDLGPIGSLDGLEGLEQTSSLSLSSTSIRSLSPLRSLRRVGNLSVFGTALLDLSGLENVSGLRNLTVTSNARLESLEGLAVDADMEMVYVRDNALLRDIGSLGDLEGVTRLEIRSNPLLARAIVFERLSRLGAFLLSGNASLRVAPAFPLVTSADGDIAIYDNPQLESLTGFASLISSNGLSILRNPRLVELDLGQLRETSTSLTIFENPGLDGAALAASLAPVASSMHRVAPDQNVANQNPCPWTSDPLCDEGWGHCAPGTDPVCQ